MAKVKILVVDDEEEICRLTRTFLARKNYQIFTATTAEQAISLVKEKQPEIVLLDVRLDGESGMDVLAKIKEFAQDIKVIMLTALDDQESIRQAKSLGADDYITKPFAASYLNEFILQKIEHLNLKPKKADEK